VKGPGYPAGVPTPYTMHVPPYPTRFHGGIWSRPAFKFPQIQQPTTVFLPPRDIDMIPDKPPGGYSGLGSQEFNVGEGIFRPGGYGGGVFDGNLAGAPSLGKARTLGDATSDAADYPWRAYSAKTAALQTATNVALKAAGYCPVAVDGKLGPATCGARNRLTIDDTSGAIYSNPSTCQDYATPTLASAGCGGGGGSTVTSIKPAQASVNSSLPLMSSNTKKVMGFVGGGLLAVGIVYFIKKRRG
jgi:hypothetical protein